MTDGITVDETFSATYTIPEANYGYLRGKLDGLQRRAVKLGQAITLTTLAEEWRDTRDEHGKPTRVKYLTVQLDGSRPVIPGWRFVATLEHLSDEANLIRAVPGEEIDPRFRTAPSWCDHCKTERRRIDTFLVYETATGTFKQVGSTCLKDYTGWADPHALASWLQILGTLDHLLTEPTEGWSPGRYGGYAYPPEEVLAHAAAWIRTDGWVSRGRARVDYTIGPATADKVAHDLNYCKYQYLTGADRCEEHLDVEDRDRIEAAKGLAWAQDLTGDLNDYLYNVHTLARAEAWEPAHLGLGCSIISAWHRAEERAINEKRRAEQQAASTWIGTKGERRTFTAQITGIRALDSQYGVVYLTKMVDAEGHILTWFGTGFDNVDQGDTVTFKGTVKDHREYDGGQETQLTRCKLEKVERRAD